MRPEDMVAAGSQTLKGDVLKIEGEYYVLKDPTGMEVRLHVDHTSQLDSDLKAGDKIEAQVTDKGHAPVHQTRSPVGHVSEVRSEYRV